MPKETRVARDGPPLRLGQAAILMVSFATEMCACGRPLHYSDPACKVVIDDFVRRLGSDQIVEIEGQKYHVQRHYIALHGLKAAEIESLVERGIARRAE